MAFNINDFVSNGLVYGGARPALFQVAVTFPTVVQGIPTDAANRFVFTCRASSIPASTIAPVPVSYFGREIKVAGDRSFADWSVTVMNDEDYNVRNAFEAWHNSINSIVSNRRVFSTELAPTGYKATADVTHYSKTGSVIKQYKIINAFPINVDEMALDWEASNQIQTFGVTFAYDWWIPFAEENDVAPNPSINVEL